MGRPSSRFTPRTPRAAAWSDAASHSRSGTTGSSICNGSANTVLFHSNSNAKSLVSSNIACSPGQAFSISAYVVFSVSAPYISFTSQVKTASNEILVHLPQLNICFNVCMTLNHLGCVWQRHRIGRSACCRQAARASHVLPTVKICHSLNRFSPPTWPTASCSYRTCLHAKHFVHDCPYCTSEPFTRVVFASCSHPLRIFIVAFAVLMPVTSVLMLVNKATPPPLMNPALQLWISSSLNACPRQPRLTPLFTTASDFSFFSPGPQAKFYNVHKVLGTSSPRCNPPSAPSPAPPTHPLIMLPHDLSHAVQASSSAF